MSAAKSITDHEQIRKWRRKAAEEKTAKQFANRGRIERGEFEKLPLGSPDGIGNDGVAMRIKVLGPSMRRVWLRPGINPNNTVTERLAWRGL